MNSDITSKKYLWCDEKRYYKLFVFCCSYKNIINSTVKSEFSHNCEVITNFSIKSFQELVT